MRPGASARRGSAERHPIAVPLAHAARALALVACGSSPAPSALAPEPLALERRLVLENGTALLRLRVSGDASAVAPPGSLDDGMRHVIELRADLHAEPDPTPVETHRLRCAVTRDAWRRAYTIEATRSIEVDHGRSRTATSLPPPDGPILGHADVARVCLDPGALDSFPAPAGRPRIDVLGRLDPPSSEDVHRLRAWIADPDAAGGAVPSSFGFIAQIFVNRSVLAARHEVLFRAEAP